MLNPGLYRALTACFSLVKIQNGGMPRKVVYVPDGSRSGKFKAKTMDYGETYVVDCPFCGDRRRRLYVSHWYGVYDRTTGSKNLHCWRCFNERCDADCAKVREFAARLFRHGYRCGRLTAAFAGHESPRQPCEQAVLPVGFTPLHELPASHDARRYLLDRGFDPVDLSIRWGVGYCEQLRAPKMSGAGWIVVPIYRLKRGFTTDQPEVALAGWQARIIGAAPSGKSKYYSSDGLDASSLFYGLPQALNTDGPVVLCEGVTDVWKIGPGGLATFGKRPRLSARQLELLRTGFADRPIVILPDRGAEQECLDLLRHLRSELAGESDDRDIVLVELPAGVEDPGDARREQLWQCIAAALDLSVPGVCPSLRFHVLDGTRIDVRQLAAQLDDRTVICPAVDNAIAYRPGGLIAGMVIARPGYTPYYVATGIPRITPMLRNRRVIYADALRDRLSERASGLTSPAYFDDLRTLRRLVRPPDFPQTTNRAAQSAPLTPGNPAAEQALATVQSVCPEVKSDSLHRRLTKLGLEFVYREIDLPIIDVTVEMMHNGVGVDHLLLQKRLRKYSRIVHTLQRKITALLGKDIDLRNGAAVAEFLGRELRLPVEQTSGKYVADKTVLDRLRDRHPVVPLILEFRRIAYLLNTISSLVETVSPVTGRIHPQLDPLGTETGRFTCTDPALQALPKALREVLVAAPGHVLIEADFSQIELRVLAHFTQDPRLVAAYARPGRDLHCRTAAALFSVREIADVSEKQRAVGKRLNFAVIYGETAASLARDLNCSQAEAEALIERYFRRYAGVSAWIEQVHEHAEDSGYVTTLYGRRRLISDILESNAARRAHGRRQAVNTIIQGTAADINKLALIRLHQELPVECRLLLTVHDSVLVEAPKRLAHRAAAQIRRIMETPPPNFRTPLAVDIRNGKSWHAAATASLVAASSSS